MVQAYHLEKIFATADLLYSASESNFSMTKFREKLEGKKGTLCIYKTKPETGY